MALMGGAGGAALAALLGLVFGSFVTAAAYRLPRDLPLAADRSRCPGCGHVLGWRDLLPLLSWLARRGRCAHCGAPVSWRYPAVEAVTALLFVVAWWVAGSAAEAALLAALAVGMAIVALVDLEFRIIPDAVQAALVPVGLLYRWQVAWAPLDMLAGAALGLGIGVVLRLAFRHLRRRRALGLGDVKFLGLAGLFLGVDGMAPFLIASGLAGVGLGLGWRGMGGGPAFPFGPALAAALFGTLAMRNMWAGF